VRQQATNKQYRELFAMCDLNVRCLQMRRVVTWQEASGLGLWQIAMACTVSALLVGTHIVSWATFGR